MAPLEHIFGSSKEVIWKQIAADIGGEYIARGFWHSGVLRFTHRNWEMLLDTFDDGNGSQYTRLRVPFLNKDKLKFKIYEEGFLSSIGKSLGLQDIIISDPRFDPKFVIQGNNSAKIKTLLKDIQLKMLFDMIPKVHVEIKRSNGLFGQRLPSDVDMLFFQQAGVIKKKEELLLLFRLFTTLLERLVQIDSAYEDDPGILLE